jgi:hypothetical protein
MPAASNQRIPADNSRDSGVCVVLNANSVRIF